MWIEKLTYPAQLNSLIQTAFPCQAAEPCHAPCSSVSVDLAQGLWIICGGWPEQPNARRRVWNLLASPRTVCQNARVFCVKGSRLMASLSTESSTHPSLLVRLRDVQDGEAWRTFVTTYAPLVYATSRRHGLQDADAADLTQDVL